MMTATGLPRRVNSTSAPASAWSTMVGRLERASAMEYLFDICNNVHRDVHQCNRLLSDTEHNFSRGIFGRSLVTVLGAVSRKNVRRRSRGLTRATFRVRGDDGVWQDGCLMFISPRNRRQNRLGVIRGSQRESLGRSPTSRSQVLW